ncbi:hypothetical protein [Sphingomonas sp. Leaf357]|uniref:hypothetical protein n=1 Tax=Sphingomonas sp. Leaf357 TaxID=1736350 RepID=UPI0012E2D60F|nr:hypothetical protein [Sphingomonas sp. Leaf357]
MADEALMCEPQAHHGKAIKLLRSTVAERLAALPDGPPPPTAKHTSSPAPVDPAKPKRNLPKPKPRSNRELQDRARQALDKAKPRYEAKRADMKPRADELAREPALEKREKTELDKLSRAHDKADAEYQRRMRAWRG